MPALSEDILFGALSWALILAGLALIAWSVFADRSRGRRRCPNCWYDMSGTPGLTCPECGRAAATERRLFRTRRHRRPAILALLLLLAACAAAHTPQVRARGPVAAVPSIVLIAALPWIDHPDAFEVNPYTVTSLDALPWSKRLYLDLRWRSSGIDSPARGAAKPGASGRGLTRLHLRLLRERAIVGDNARRPPGEAPDGGAAWRSHYLPFLQDDLDRHLSAAGGTKPPDRLMQALARATLGIRDRWPAGEPLRVAFYPYLLTGDLSRRIHMTPQLHTPNPLHGYAHHRGMMVCGEGGDGRWDDGTIPIGLLDPQQTAISFTVRIDELADHEDPGRTPGRVLWSGELSIPIRVVADAADAIDPHESAPLNADLARLTPVLHKWADHGEVVICWLYIDDRRNRNVPSHTLASLLRNHPSVTLGATLTIKHAGTTVGTGRCWWRARHYPRYTSLLPSLSGDIIEFIYTRDAAPFPPDAADDGRWTLTITNDPAMALRDVESPARWTGEVTVPLALHVPRPTPRAALRGQAQPDPLPR